MEEIRHVTVEEAVRIIEDMDCKVPIFLQAEGIEWDGNDIMFCERDYLGDAVVFLVGIGLTQKNLDYAYRDWESDLIVRKRTKKNLIGSEL